LKIHVEAEKKACTRNVGIWPGEFIKFWNWLKGKRLYTGKAARSENCLIKGNISVRGKIYHILSSN